MAKSKSTKPYPAGKSPGTDRAFGGVPVTSQKPGVYKKPGQKTNAGQGTIPTTAGGGGRGKAMVGRALVKPPVSF